MIGDNLPAGMKKAVAESSCECGHPKKFHVITEKLSEKLRVAKRMSRKKATRLIAESKKVEEGKGYCVFCAFDLKASCSHYRSVIHRTGPEDEVLEQRFHVPLSEPQLYKDSGPRNQLKDHKDTSAPTHELPEGKPVTAPHKLRSLAVSNSVNDYRRVMAMPVFGAGLVNWFKALGSDMASPAELGEDPASALERYDWVLLNLAGTDLGVPAKLRNALGWNSSTKLVVNDDYAVEVLQKAIQDSKGSLNGMLKDLYVADLLFAQEPYQLEMMNYIIRWNKEDNARKNIGSRYPITTLISHPVNTANLKQWAVTDLDQRSPTIGIMYHRLDGQTYIPSLIARNQPASWFNGMPPLTCMYSYVDKYNIFSNEDRLFDIMVEHLDFGRLLYLLVTNIAALDYYTIHSHSRFSGECACLRVPLVTTDFSFNARTLFPNNVAPYWKWQDLRDKLARLVSDEKYWNECVDHAYDKVEEFNYPNSIGKLKMAMEFVR